MPKKHIHDHPHNPRTRVLYGISAALLLMLGTLCFEHTQTGRDFEYFIYVVLQRNMVPSYLAPPPAIQVVDLSNLKIEQLFRADAYEPSRNPTFVIDRPQLLEAIEFILEHGATGVAVDADFSLLLAEKTKGGPRLPDYRIPADKDFFDQCLKLSKQYGKPICLGVWQTQGLSDGRRWLVEEQFRPLAASMMVGDVHETNDSEWESHLDSRWFPRWYGYPDSTDKLPTFGTVLSGRMDAIMRGDTGLMTRILPEEHEVLLKHDLKGGFALADYSQLRRIVENTIMGADPATLGHYVGRFDGKAVILGRTERFTIPDTFNVPGENKPIPGVFLHACYCTSCQQQPALRELSKPASILLDIGLAASIFMTLSLVAARHKSAGGKKRFNEAELHWLLTGVAIVCVLGVGYFFVGFFRIMWFDFVAVIGALLLHSLTERAFPKLLLKFNIKF